MNAVTEQMVLHTFEHSRSDEFMSRSHIHHHPVLLLRFVIQALHTYQ